jgi:PhnB protein
VNSNPEARSASSTLSVFNGPCDEALGFYRKMLGAEVTMLTRFNDNPNAAINPPGPEDKVMRS